MTFLTKKQTKILSDLVEMFPEIKTSGLVYRKDLTIYKEQNNLPWSAFSFITDKKAGWGIYSVPSEINMNDLKLDTNPVQNVTNPHQEETSMVQNVVSIQQPLVKNHGIPEHDTSSMIPDVDSNYIPFGVYKEMEQLIKSEIFAPVYITGHSGTGKNVMVEQICAKHRRSMIRINFHAQMTEEDLIGSKTLVDGNIEIVEGPVLIAMRTGSILVCDEIDASSPNALFALQSICEGKPYYFRLKNELIHPKKGFNIVALGNTLGKGDESGRYMGTNILNEAFLERFAIAFHQTYPTQAIEKKIVNRLMKSLECENEEFAESLTKWSDAIRRTFEVGGIDEVISTRRITHIVKTYAIFGNARRAIELGCNRFDEMTRIAFIDLFDKITSPPDENTTTNVAEEPEY
jgi:MoxR-like ATPase